MRTIVRRAGHRLWPLTATLLAAALLALLGAPALAQEDGGQRIQGVIRDAEAEPVPGIDITVAAEGDFEEVATTGDDGMWGVDVPAAGTYSVELSVDSLGDVGSLRNPDNNPLEIDVTPGATRNVLFPIGEPIAVASTTDLLLDATANGVKFGLIIAMTAVGLSLIFGTTGMINFAHGELVAFGAILAWFLNVAGDLPLPVAALIAVAAGGLLGGALERGLFRPLRDRRVGNFQLLVITIGLSLFGQNALLIWFGGQPTAFGDFVGQSQFAIGPFEQTPRDWTIMALSVLVLVGVATLLQFTRTGKAMRAVADNVDLAESSGIDVRRVILIVWVVGGGLAALGGVFQGSAVTVEPLMGFKLLLLMFAGVILGGLGTAYGAMVGSLIVGITTELSTIPFDAELKVAWALLVLILVLLVRPQGILGRAERVG